MSKTIIPSVILYAAATIFGAYSVWAFVNSAGIISEAVKAGQISISANLFDVVSFYMTNAAQYAATALLLAAAGLILRGKTADKSAAPPQSTAQDSANDKELDEWFSGAE